MMRLLRLFLILLTFAAIAGCEPVNKVTPVTPPPTDTTVATPQNKVDSEPAPKVDPAVKAEEDAKAVAWIPVAEREKLYLDFKMEDQEGKPFDFKAIKGKPTIATFIFTRCPNPQMCPLQGAKMAALQKTLAAQSLGDKVNVLIISFDPEYDTPARLKTFAQAAGFDLKTGHALRPDPREFEEFRYVFQFRISYQPDGQLTHRTDLMMIDAEGRLARQYAGMWEDKQAVEDVKKLIDEAEASGE
ncbi:MAG: SCO family protein [Phycisphaeraceae bacterium]